MRVLVIATPRTTAPPEMIMGLIDRAEEWHQRYEEKFESFGLFPGGGGFGVADVKDDAELHRMMAEMPFSMFSNVEVRSFVDGATGWRQAREAIAAMMAPA
jgi:muconolactone delta-isomerase